MAPATATANLEIAIIDASIFHFFSFFKVKCARLSFNNRAHSSSYPVGLAYWSNRALRCSSSDDKVFNFWRYKLMCFCNRRISACRSSVGIEAITSSSWQEKGVSGSPKFLCQNPSEKYAYPGVFPALRKDSLFAPKPEWKNWPSACWWNTGRRYPSEDTPRPIPQSRKKSGKRCPRSQTARPWYGRSPQTLDTAG